MIIIRALAFLLFFTVIPMAVGRLITYKARVSLTEEYLIGFFGNLGIFYILYSVIAWLQLWVTMGEAVTGAFTLLLKAYFPLIAVLLIAWLVLERKSFSAGIKTATTRFGIITKKIFTDGFTVIYFLAFMAVLVLQLYMAYGYEVNEWSYDDYDYVVSSKDTITYDALSYVNIIDGTMPNTLEKRLAYSWDSYIAMLSKVSGFEVTTVCHTILPVLFLLIAYSVYYYIAQFIFEKTDDRLIFLLILSFAYIFGLYSHYSVTFRLLGAIWQGKAVLTVIAIPFFTMYLIKSYSSTLSNGRILPIIAISMGASSLTSLGIIFIPIMAVITWVLMCAYNKRIYGIRYLIASLVGPAYLGVFYTLIWMLQSDATGGSDQYFPFRRRHEWWYKWFKENI
ncbi:hypothetical protein SAMN04487831_103248 [Pseudobutyrivibrio sp. UC1225]|uniref:DUF6077 domain-containing protein n=1 Tax=Pseudobutyrivibrio sp. UC1225 TaxID=1798185 RepID=UPI0008E855C1|nr:DUF6077 domain-containing protein [Pseudobutyrivibrio sp. UC1225]SFN77634.1 hypothetical protein SAMN04487831_103248 [Pseudobutyrivibrio sp. UC1225]